MQTASGWVDEKAWLVLLRQGQSGVLPGGGKRMTCGTAQTTRFSMTSVFCRLASYLLQIIHMWKVNFHKLPTSFPHKTPLFPQSLRMWKSYQQSGYPQKVFHIFAFFQAKSRVLLWKTMWKVWKRSTCGEKPIFAENQGKRFFHGNGCGKATGREKPFWQRFSQSVHEMGEGKCVLFLANFLTG